MVLPSNDQLILAFNADSFAECSYLEIVDRELRKLLNVHPVPRICIIATTYVRFFPYLPYSKFVWCETISQTLILRHIYILQPELIIFKSWRRVFRYMPLLGICHIRTDLPNFHPMTQMRVAAGASVQWLIDPNALRKFLRCNLLLGTWNFWIDLSNVDPESLASGSLLLHYAITWTFIFSLVELVQTYRPPCYLKQLLVSPFVPPHNLRITRLRHFTYLRIVFFFFSFFFDIYGMVSFHDNPIHESGHRPQVSQRYSNYHLPL